jgi:signal transduction histidine kinase
MKRSVLGEPAASTEYNENRRLTSDLFHQLSQPLTTLCCALELAVLQSPTTHEYGEIVNQALQQAEKASALATAIRELLDASHAGENAEVLDLQRAVGDAVGDMLPVAESAGIELDLVPRSRCPVWFDARRLRQGLFHLLGSLIGTGRRGSVLKIEIEAREPQAKLCLRVSGVTGRNGTSEPQPDRELQQRLELGISRTIFEAAGSTFNVERGVQALVVNVRLPRKPLEKHEPQRTQRYSKETRRSDPS